MMSSENIPPAPETHNSGNRKGASQRAATQEQPPLKCPRCDSSNTKFCYYNNYSLSQPRHFCKTCRRYWTKGGALRNVPIGGGCRKTRKIKPPTSSSSASRLLSSGDPAAGDFAPGFNLLSSGPQAQPMDFQLGGLSLPRLHPATAGVFTQFITNAGPCPGFGLDLAGLSNYPTTTSSVVSQSSGGGDPPVSISSIESLSSINQEMHWKLQQQRLSLIYGGDENNNEKEKPQAAINLFQNLEIDNNVNDSTPKASATRTHNTENDIGGGGRKLEVGVGPTEWYFEHASFAPNATATTTAAAPPPWIDLHHFNGVQ